MFPRLGFSVVRSSFRSTNSPGSLLFFCQQNNQQYSYHRFSSTLSLICTVTLTYTNKMRRDANVSGDITFDNSPAGESVVLQTVGKRGLFSKLPYLNKVSLLIIFLLLADVLYILHLPTHTFETTENFFDHLISPHSDYHNASISKGGNSKDINDHEMDGSLHFMNDKAPIFKILQQANIRNINELGNETLEALPTWSQITRLFGDRPQIIGLDRCEAYRESVSPSERYIGVAGAFNSGTNILSRLLELNCQITEKMKKYGKARKGIKWQVPWGKHSLASRRFEYAVGNKMNKNEQASTLPIVMIRDPYQWMQSMCHHTYGSDWRHGGLHCPNLVPNTRDLNHFKKLKGLDHVPVHTYYQPDFKTDHDSLVHMWNDWYQRYLNATFPRIMIRFEDLLFHGEEVIDKVCKCAGGEMRQDRTPIHFVHQMKSAKLAGKSHGKEKTNFLDALIKYGSHDHRLDNMTSDDLKYAAKHLDERIMDMFGYSIAGI